MSLADLQLSHCRSCNAQIYWLKNDTTGKPAPIDTKPDQAGSVIVTVDGGALRYHVLTKAELTTGVDTDRYTNHFQTCPNAARHHKTA